MRIVESHVEDAKARGARVLAGGTRLPELGPNFYAPTVLADVTQEMRIMREETFGPVLPVMACEDDDEAVRLANDSEYGLAASVWTRDKKRGERLARRIHAGTVMVNDVISCFGISEAPHGGVKASGVGRTHGRFGLEEMVQGEIPRYRSHAGNEKSLVARVRGKLSPPDGRLSGYAVRARAGDAAAWSAAGCGSIKAQAAVKSSASFALAGRANAPVPTCTSKCTVALSASFANSFVESIAVAAGVRDYKEAHGAGGWVANLMTLSRQHANAGSSLQQHGFSFNLHQDFARYDVEELLRFLVMVANLGRAGWHELLDHAELFIVDQIPGVTIYSPTIVLCILPAHRT